VFANKRVFYKQRDNNFYPPASYVLSYLLTQLPQSTVEVTLFSLVVYWVSRAARLAPPRTPPRLLAPCRTAPPPAPPAWAAAPSSLAEFPRCCCCCHCHAKHVLHALPCLPAPPADLWADAHRRQLLLLPGHHLEPEQL
jgi:hypothetical protein